MEFNNEDFRRMNEKLDTVATNQAVLTESMSNLKISFETYAENKDKVDEKQNCEISDLKEHKADKSDINKLRNDLKWAVGTIIAIVSVIVTIAQFFF